MTIFRLAPLAALASFLSAQQPAFRWPDGARAAVCLTYDDGVDVHLDHVVPDLDAQKLRGTFFVPGNSASLARRMEEWRAMLKRGHEIGNHSIFHPCLRVSAEGARREWLSPEYELEKYTVAQMIAELRAMNTMLLALDGRSSHTYAYTCSDTVAGGQSFVDPLRPLFLAARGGGNRVVIDPLKLDVHLVPSWMVQNVSGEDLIAYAKEAAGAGGMAVIMFHGVGGGHSISVPREAHRMLLAWLAANRQQVWTDTFESVMRHVISERNRLGVPLR